VLFICYIVEHLFYPFILSSTVSQLIVTKKPRLGPKVCTHAWWIDKVKEVECPRYSKYWTHYTDFEIGQFKALAEYNYFVLGEGIETQGAPDFGLNLEYPIKLVVKPFLGELEYPCLQRLQALDLDPSSQGFGKTFEQEDCYLV
jgi:hypothetical protein